MSPTVAQTATAKIPAESGPYWAPHAGPQTKFLASPAREVLYGGAAGGGKTDALLVAPLRYAHLRHFEGVLFRRTFPELERRIIKRAYELYPKADPGARYNDSKHIWIFSSGARIHFCHLEHDQSVHQHQSAEYQYLGFDELTTFSEYQYRYLLSRARSAHGIPIRIRSGSNPDDNWVLRRWAPWVDDSDEYDGQRAGDGEILSYVIDEENDSDIYVPHGTLGSLTRQFIRATLEDNPTLDQADPEYRSRLAMLDPVQRERLRDGKWTRLSPGMLFKRGWFEIVAAAPAQAFRVRYWDRAATEAKLKAGKPTNDPDYTVGVLYAWARNGGFFVEDVIRIRAKPGEVFNTIRQTATLDGPNVVVGLEEEPGASGKFEAAAYVGALPGFTVRTFRPSGDKVVRAGPSSAQASAGNVKLVRGPWNGAFLRELERFPGGEHDDQVDALSGAHMEVTSRVTWKPPMNLPRR